jgi:hypothetical protein
MICKIADVDRPNKNGRIYPREVFEKLIGQTVPLYIKEQEFAPPTLLDLVGECRVAAVADHNVTADVILLSTEAAQSAKALLESGVFSVVTAGYGNIDGEKNEVQNYVLTGTYLTTDPSWTP